MLPWRPNYMRTCIQTSISSRFENHYVCLLLTCEILFLIILFQCWTTWRLPNMLQCNKCQSPNLKISPSGMNKVLNYPSLFTIKSWISFVQYNVFQAEDISRDAKWIFEAFPNPYHFNSKLFLDKRSPTRKPQNEQLGTSQKVSPKEIGIKTLSSFKFHVILVLICSLVIDE